MKYLPYPFWQAFLYAGRPLDILDGVTVSNKTKQTKLAEGEAEENVKEVLADETVQQGIKSGIVEVKGEKIYYLAINKIYSFSDPEEKIRARVYVELIMKYGYPPNRILMEVYPPRREPKLPADIVVYKDDKLTTPYVVVETKAESTDKRIEEAKREGLGNANLLLSEYLFCVCQREELAYDVRSHPSLKTLDDKLIAQIPIAYGLTPVYKYKRGAESPFGLRRASFSELRNKFQRCHDAIWDGGKRDPATSFDEMSKLMFVKIFDEIRETAVGDFYRFQVGTNETPAVVTKRILELYAKAQRNEPEIFGTEIELPDSLVYTVVAILQDISLTETDLDAKGKAFEHFIGKYFRGEYGQYFTPRQIVEFMVSVVNPTEDDIVVDPACGSGGFLLYTLNAVRSRIVKKYAGDERTINNVQRDFALKRLFGIEISDQIARIAMMDMVIHEDGHSNIERADALGPVEAFDTRKQIELGKYSLVLTNPPFGNDIKAEEKGYFGDFIFGSRLKRNRKSQKSEILFLERCIDLLAPNGVLGIVLPDSALSNLGNIEVCEHIFKTTRIFAVVSLPQFTFSPFGSDAKTSLLFLRKDASAEQRLGEKNRFRDTVSEIRKNDTMGKEEKRKEIEAERHAVEEYDYPIFMAYIGKVGHDATGREDENYLPDVLEELHSFGKDPAAYKGLYRDEDFWTVQVDFFDLTNKLDVEAYSPDYFRVIEEIESSKNDVKSLGNVCTIIFNGYNPTSNKYRASGVPILKTADVVKLIGTNDRVKGETIGVVDWDSVDSFLDESECDCHTDKRLMTGDILVQSVAHTRAYIADKVAIIDHVPSSFNDKVLPLGKFLVVRPDNTKVNPQYLAMFLSSPLGKVQLVHFVRGMTAEIYEIDVRDTLVVLPRRDVQDEVENRVNAIKKDFMELQSRLDGLKLELSKMIKSQF